MLTESERAFLNRMYGTYARTLLVYSFSMLRTLPDAFPMAEECVQETFERAMLRMHTLARHRSPERWLMNTSFLGFDPGLPQTVAGVYTSNTFTGLITKRYTGMSCYYMKGGQPIDDPGVKITIRYYPDRARA